MAGAPKRLVICCDGTWNRPDQVSDGAVSPTNVTKVAVGLERRGSDGREQRLYYHKGVGTRRFERIRGGAFGLGLSRNVRDCYRFLVRNYRPGDQVFLFGFSRGAFTARSTAGFVRNCGILLPEHEERIGDAYRLYRARQPERHPNGIESELFRRMYSYDEKDTDIHFIGVWDTVGALGIPVRLPLVSLLNRRYAFHDPELSSHVGNAFHALAIDERRRPFEPTVWKQDPDAEQALEQVWFAGVHSDVGGGYSEPSLSEIPLLWMVEKARACGLTFKADHFRRPDDGADKVRRTVGADVDPDALGELHNSLRHIYRLLPKTRFFTNEHRQSVASTAVQRREAKPEYRPVGLEAYLATSDQATRVSI